MYNRTDRKTATELNKSVTIDPFSKDPNIAYELARNIGDRRFGSECKHEHVKNGICQNCQRKVM